jgi:two-component system response regulator (stage 0 sporulation protein F)
MTRETNNRSSQAKPGQERSAEARMPRILVAEDDDEMRALLGQALRASGYEVAELSDGLHLVARLASKESGEFGAIVSDIRMPGVSGLEVLEGLRKCKGAPPVILITAFGDRETHMLARRLGAAAMFDKPFDMEELLAELRRVAPLSLT